MSIIIPKYSIQFKQLRNKSQIQNDLLSMYT